MSLSHRSRGGRSAAERAWRSRVCQLVQAEGLVQGSLVAMARTCGNPGCRCLRQGRKHVSWYLAVTRQGKPRRVYIPREWEVRVKGWVARHQEMRRVLKELSELHMEKLRRRQE